MDVFIRNALANFNGFIHNALSTVNGNYNLVAVVTILTCDILETVHDEITYIWKKQFGIIGLLYMVTRYLPFLVNVVILGSTVTVLPAEQNVIGASVAPALINPWDIMLLYGIPWFVVLACTEYLFIMRAVALNGNSRLLYYSLLVLFIGEIVTSSVFYLKSLPSPIATLHFVSPNDGDVTSPFQSTFVFSQFPTIFAFGIPELVFQSILVLVIIITIIRNRRTWLFRERSTSLTTIIIRDGLWGYFFNIFGLLVIIIQPPSGFDNPFWSVGPAGQPSIQWSYVTFSMTCSRLLLNIRSGGGTPGVAAITSFSFPFNLNSKSQTDTELVPIADHGVHPGGKWPLVDEVGDRSRSSSLFEM